MKERGKRTAGEARNPDSIAVVTKDPKKRRIPRALGTIFLTGVVVFGFPSCGDADTTSGPDARPTSSPVAGIPLRTPTAEIKASPPPTAAPTATLAPMPVPTEQPKPTGTAVSIPPTATTEPKPTPTLSPEPTEVVKAPNLGVRYDPIEKNCAVVDRDTGEAVDTSNTSIERISYQETGVGVTEDILITLLLGQTAIIQGWEVDGKGDGVFKAVIATEDTLEFRVNISDGAVEIVDNQDGPSALCRAVNTAVRIGHAHENIEIPDAWKITQ